MRETSGSLAFRRGCRFGDGVRAFSAAAVERDIDQRGQQRGGGEADAGFHADREELQ